jgi:hypothetical protein
MKRSFEEAMALTQPECLDLSFEIEEEQVSECESEGASDEVSEEEGSECGSDDKSETGDLCLSLIRVDVVSEGVDCEGVGESVGGDSDEWECFTDDDLNQEDLTLPVADGCSFESVHHASPSPPPLNTESHSSVRVETTPALTDPPRWSTHTSTSQPESAPIIMATAPITPPRQTIRHLSHLHPPAHSSSCPPPGYSSAKIFSPTMPGTYAPLLHVQQPRQHKMGLSPSKPTSKTFDFSISSWQRWKSQQAGQTPRVRSILQQQQQQRLLRHQQLLLQQQGHYEMNNRARHPQLTVAPHLVPAGKAQWHGNRQRRHYGNQYQLQSQQQLLHPHDLYRYQQGQDSEIHHQHQKRPRCNLHHPPQQRVDFYPLRQPHTFHFPLPVNSQDPRKESEK